MHNAAHTIITCIEDATRPKVQPLAHRRTRLTSEAMTISGQGVLYLCPLTAERPWNAAKKSLTPG